MDANGVPINQEDMAATLLAFSINALDGVEFVGGMAVPKQDQEDYLALWRYIGWILGVYTSHDDDKALPCTTTTTPLPPSLDPCGPGWQQAHRLQQELVKRSRKCAPCAMVKEDMWVKITHYELVEQQSQQRESLPKDLLPIQEDRVITKVNIGVATNNGEVLQEQSIAVRGGATHHVDIRALHVDYVTSRAGPSIQRVHSIAQLVGNNERERTIRWDWVHFAINFRFGMQVLLSCNATSFCCHQQRRVATANQIRRKALHGYVEFCRNLQRQTNWQWFR